MRRCPAFAVTFAITLATLLAAQAAAAPRLVPMRDVTVDYTVQPRDARLQAVRVSISAGGQHLRISAQDFPAIILVDRGARTADILVPLLRGYTTADIARYDPEATVLRGARFIRGGVHRIAGLPCTDWSATSASGTAEACITEDGVILRGSASDRHGRLASVVASTVAYGGLDRLTFARPEDFRFVGDLPPGLLGVRP